MESTAPRPDPNMPTKSNGRTIAVIASLILVGLLIAGIMPRIDQEKKLTEDSADLNTAVHEVNVTSPHLAVADALILPSTMKALDETQIYARTNGYISKRYVDIGSRVKAGQVLAEIQSPDVDQQELQAIADQAKAVATVGQSQADVRNKEASVEQTKADVAKSQAMIGQAQAALEGSKSRLAQTRAALSSAQAKVAQTRHALDIQKSALKQTQAQQELAEQTAKRYRSMLQQGYVAQQDADQAEATLKTANAAVESSKSSIGAAEADVQAALQDVESNKALVKAAQADVQSSVENITASRAALSSSIATVTAASANVGVSKANVTASIAQVNSNKANTQRFSVLQGFSKIIAPFDGVITGRNADVGTLVAPGDSSNTKLALFSMARVGTLRIQVSVPQTYFQAVRPGTKTTVLVKEIPGRKFEGTIFENAGAIDPATRTLLTEVRVPNTDNVLIPGMYAQVKFDVGGTVKSLRIPSNTLMVDAGGPKVVVVGPDSKLKFVPIVIGKDFGTEIEVSGGLTGDEQLVTNPTDDLKPDQPVKILAAAAGGKQK